MRCDGYWIGDFASFPSTPYSLRWASNKQVRRRKERKKSDHLDNIENYTFIKISKVFFLAIFGFYTLQAFQRYQKRLKRSSDENVMSETKLEAKQWDYSENFRYHGENLALRKFRIVCEIFAMSNREFVFLIKNKNKIVNK